MRYFALVLGLVGACAAVMLGGPVKRGMTAVEPVMRLSPDRFRCVLVGDSQTTDPSANRVRTQTHRWDAPIIGELVCVGASSTGFVVNNSNAGITDLLYQNVDLNAGWPGGGPDDFFALHGANWTCLGDIDAPGWRIGRYALRFGGNNTNAPWDEAWGVGQPLVARIAVRTGPMSVDSVEVRPERGGVASYGDRTVHTIGKKWGVQIIEQPIPVGIDPEGDTVGIGLYLPSGSVEKPGQMLQVLGVVIERVGPKGQRLNGTLIGYQGRGGWDMRDHLDGISQASRSALVEMVDADFVMVMLGHNREPGGQDPAANLDELVGVWESAFADTGRRRPGFVYVVPWAISGAVASDYLLEVEAAMLARGAANRLDQTVNYLPLHDYMRPDLYDPARYQLDGARVHPGNVSTAVNLAEDLFELLFEGRRE